MPDLSILEELLNLGMGAVIAGILLIWKRADDQRHEKQLTDFLGREEGREERLLNIMSENTEALRALQAAVKGISVMKDIEKQIQDLNAAVGRPRSG